MCAALYITVSQIEGALHDEMSNMLFSIPSAFPAASEKILRAIFEVKMGFRVRQIRYVETDHILLTTVGFGR